MLDDNDRRTMTSVSMFINLNDTAESLRSQSRDAHDGVRQLQFADLTVFVQRHYKKRPTVVFEAELLRITRLLIKGAVDAGVVPSSDKVTYSVKFLPITLDGPDVAPNEAIFRLGWYGLPVGPRKTA